MNERDIFIAALHKPNAADRSGFLQEACGDNAALRQQVEVLLRQHDQLGSFLESPAGEPPTGAHEPLTERPGAVIGPYKLLQQIGEGGMGVVYMAEQEQPLRRRVAFKIIKPGMDSAQVIARFEAERQALALMDHQNIAKVLDAGTTDSGRPYFVMELVHGVPITHYCGAKKSARWPARSSWDADYTPKFSREQQVHGLARDLGSRGTRRGPAPGVAWQPTTPTERIGRAGRGRGSSL
jgi:hypothetical protein